MKLLNLFRNGEGIYYFLLYPSFLGKLGAKGKILNALFAARMALRTEKANIDMTANMGILYLRNPNIEMETQYLGLTKPFCKDILLFRFSNIS